MIFEDDDTLRMYVEESLEHLGNIENDLLVIEEDGENINVDLVNSVFRAAHSIKGGAGFMGLTVIKDLSHNLENILGLVRNKELVPNPDMVSVLLNAFDRLKELITDIESSNDQDISDHVEKLVKVTASTLPEEEQGSIVNKVDIKLPNDKVIFQVPQYDIDQAKKEGKFIYLVELDLIKDIHNKGTTPLRVITSLLSSGIIIDTKIDIEAVGTLDTTTSFNLMPFLILFASIIEPDITPTLFDVDPSKIHSISDDLSPIPLNEILKSEAASEPSPTVKKTEKAPEKAKAAAAPVETKPVSEKPKQTAEIKQQKTAPAKQAPKKTPEHKAPIAQASLRVNVDLLDTLMTLAGELVLSRNQLLQGLSANNTRALEGASQRIDMITSELQEAIMRTRMQPIGNVFTKFTRVVRDLARDLNKKIDLQIEGRDVELDKTIIESINDPLTHLVRNSVDHGIELPDYRISIDKPATGTVKLKAFHEAGQVNIEIEDDGKGLDGEVLAASAIKKGLMTEQQISTMSEKEKTSLIFLPGFSTAKEITDVSGRGVGMDVVKTNLDKLGGIVDLVSQVGKGTTVKIKLPLTLAIIPSQIISVGNERYAIPQVNLNELLRIPAAQVKERIEKVGNADVVRLRGALLPLLNLAEVLGIERSFINPEDGKEYQDRRQSIADRRSVKSPLFKNRKQALEQQEDDDKKYNRKKGDRRISASSAINIAVVSAGPFKYGLVVDKLRDSEEIVVKPLGRHLKDCSGYAGATIMGDGKVALILDVATLALMGQLSSLEGTDRVAEASQKAKEQEERQKDRASLLLFKNNDNEQLAAPLNLVERIERIASSDIESVGNKKVIQYRGGSLPLYEISEVSNLSSLPERSQLEVIVFKLAGREVGLMVTPPVDALEVSLEIDGTTLKQPGIMGSVIINKQTTLMVDIFEVVKILNPDWFEAYEADQLDDSEQKTILFAEDSKFFRDQVKSFLEDDGYNVLTAEDGVIAWELLQERYEDIDIIITDIEMPNMNGFELTKNIKGSPQFSHYKVIALTSLAGEADIKQGKEAGIDEYQTKLDRENLLQIVKKMLFS